METDRSVRVKDGRLCFSFYSFIFIIIVTQSHDTMKEHRRF